MTSQLHQIQLSFVPEHDRLLLRIKSTDLQEVRLWLTRRFVKLAWPNLIKLLSSDPTVAVQQSAQAQEAILAFEHEKALSQANFSDSFSEETQQLPLGNDPVLVTRLTLRKEKDDRHLICFHPTEGQGVEIGMHTDMIHSLCKLIIETTARADWDIDLAVTSLADTARSHTSTTLN